MKCLLKNCNNTIPVTRKRSAKYCSEECNYRARKQRSIDRYAALKSISEEIKRCENILASFYELIHKLKKEVTTKDFEAYNFNFNLAIDETLDNKKRLCKIIGNYVYNIDTDKTVTIWKLKKDH